MRTVIVLISMIMTFGILRSQMSFYVSPDIYTKMSFNSTDPFDWDSKTTQVSDLFTYEHKSFCLYAPIRYGITFGVRLNNKNSFEMGIHEDGVSSSSRLRFASYQQYVDFVTPVYTLSQARTAQSRIFINYKRKILGNNNKSTLSIVPNLGLAWRSGNLNQESVGSFSTNGILTKSGIVYDLSNKYYTSMNGKYALLFGLGISSELYFKGNYWFSISMNYSHTDSNLYFKETKMKITDSQTGESTTYVFSQYQRASGLYLSVSRKFQLIPWKGKSKSE